MNVFLLPQAWAGLFSLPYHCICRQPPPRGQAGLVPMSISHSHVRFTWSLTTTMWNGKMDTKMFSDIFSVWAQVSAHGSELFIQTCSLILPRSLQTLAWVSGSQDTWTNLLRTWEPSKPYSIWHFLSSIAMEPFLFARWGLDLKFYFFHSESSSLLLPTGLLLVL